MSVLCQQRPADRNRLALAESVNGSPELVTARLGEVDVIILCVPTPLTKHREPDLTYVTQTTESIAPHLRHGQLVVLGDCAGVYRFDGYSWGALEWEGGAGRREGVGRRALGAR